MTRALTHEIELQADDRARIGLTVTDLHGGPDLAAVRQAMFAYQQHTEGVVITARLSDGRELARLTFEWAD